MTNRPHKDDATNADSFWGTAVGHIHHNVEFWKRELDADEYVLNILSEGFKVVFTKMPPDSYYEDNNKSAKQNWDFVETEVLRLWERGSIVRVNKRPAYCNPLTVVNKRGKQ